MGIIEAVHSFGHMQPNLLQISHSLSCLGQYVVNAVIHDKRWKQDVLFSERTELITRLEHGCETFSLLHIFFGRHLAVEPLCLMVIASLSHENSSNTTYLTATATGWHSHIHTRLCGFLQTVERRKGMRCSKICVWSPFPCSISALSPQWSSTSFNLLYLFIKLSVRP